MITEEAQVLSRRLAAIMVADISGYGTLMGADQEATVRDLQAHRAAVLPLIDEHGGRVVDLAGDGILAEFPSALGAVKASLALQASMAERNANVPPQRRIEFRIGINLGEIIHDQGRIYGDGINIAARLQAYAQPGGICVSGKVLEEVRDRTEVTSRHLGEHQLKHIAHPVHIYALEAKSSAGPSSPVPTGPLPSLAVLPFQNLSGDPEQDYFADGVVEDMITALSRFKSFAVIARNSSFVYKGRAVDVRQVSRELGVRYVLEGSVRRAMNRLRISAQLIDGTTGAHIWAHTYDGVVESVFDFQDRITETVAAMVEPQIRQAEIERSRRERPDSLDAYDLYLQALPLLYSVRAKDNAAAFGLLLKATELSPTFAPALSGAAWALDHRSSMGWAPLSEDDRKWGLDLAQAAIANAKDDATVLAHCGMALVSAHEYERGFITIQRAVEANPNNLVALFVAGIGHLHCGSLDQAMAYFERTLQLSPSDPDAHFPFTGIAHVQMCLGAFAQALAWAEKSFAINPDFDCTLWMLIAGNAQLGRLEEARRYLGYLQRVTPGVTVARIREGQPQKDPTRMAAILEGLRMAGLPEA